MRRTPARGAQGRRAARSRSSAAPGTRRHSPSRCRPRPPRTRASCKGMPKRKAALTWVPWTHSRLAAASGYGAGIASPGWYHHLFTAPDQPVVPLAHQGRGGAAGRGPAGVVGARHRGGPARRGAGRDARPAARRARRGHRGDPRRAVRGRRRAARARHHATSSSASALGAVPEDAPTVPLEADLRATAQTLRLKRGPAGQDASTLDLRARHRPRPLAAAAPALASSEIDWGRPADDDVAAPARSGRAGRSPGGRSCRWR